MAGLDRQHKKMIFGLLLIITYFDALRNPKLNFSCHCKILIAVLVFFHVQAFGEICLLWLNIAGCVYTFFPINRAAAGLMLPYLGWVTLATALNYSIWQMNKPAIKED